MKVMFLFIRQCKVCNIKFLIIEYYRIMKEVVHEIANPTLNRSICREECNDTSWSPQKSAVSFVPIYVTFPTL